MQPTAADYGQNYYTERHIDFTKKNLDLIPAFSELKTLTAPKENEKILEAGSGIGYVLHYILKDSKAKGYGIDFVDHAVDKAKELYPQYNFSCQDATKTNFEDNTFDKIFCFHVIEHVPDYKKLLVELKRILRPNGKIIMGTEMLEALNTKIFNLFIGDPTHIKEFYKQELIDEMNKFFHVEKYITASCVGRFPQYINWFFHTFLKGEIIISAKKV